MISVLITMIIVKLSVFTITRVKRSINEIVEQGIIGEFVRIDRSSIQLIFIYTDMHKDRNKCISVYRSDRYTFICLD